MPGPDVEVIDPTRMQATIARRMAESKSTVPEFTVTVEARVDEAVKMRQQLKDSVPGAEKVTMTDFLVRASALALRKFPEVNTSWVDGRFQRKRAVNIGLAVAPSQGMGLLVPVVHDADRRAGAASSSGSTVSRCARSARSPPSPSFTCATRCRGAWEPNIAIPAESGPRQANASSILSNRSPTVVLWVVVLSKYPTIPHILIWYTGSILKVFRKGHELF